MGSKFCDNCEKPAPPGCYHMFGSQSACALGDRKDIQWQVGKAIWDELADRRGIGHEMEQCSEDIQSEIVDTIGGIALRFLSQKSRP